MQKAAVYHRPDSAMAYLKDKNTVQIRLRLKHRDVLGVELLYADPYAIQAADGLWHPEVIAMKCLYQSVVADYWLAEFSLPANRRLEYAFHLLGPEGEEYIYDDRKLRPYTADCLKHVAPFKLPYFATDDVLETPKWARSVVWYDIFLDSFANGDTKNDHESTLEWDSQEANETSFFGGDLQGVIDRLDYLQELGVNGLYLGALFVAYSNHKFDPIDFYSLAPTFGTKEKLKELILQAHQRGMKVMIDGVFHHVGDFSLQWQDVKRYGRQSRFADWFLIHDFPPHYVPTDNPHIAKSLSYEVFANNPHLPKLNTKNPAVKDYLLQVARYWLENFDIDAWHLSCADEVDHEFWHEFYRQAKRIKPDVCLLGQVKQDASSRIERREFDGTTNEALMGILRDYFIEHEIPLAEMIHSLNEQLMKYRDQNNQVMLNALDNRNTLRLLAQCGDDAQLLRALLAFVFMQPGMPCLYYGTEIGLSGTQPFANRNCMKWNKEQQDETMHRFVKLLISFRRRYSDLLTQGSLEWGQCNSKFDFLSFTRTLGNCKIFALFNMGYGSVKFVLPKNAKLILSQNLLEDQHRVGQNGFVIIEA